ncbi:MAG: serine hydrolase domain-containing protein [Litorimonas sp.]
MKLFLKIVGGIIAVLALIIVGFWLSAKISNRPGPEAAPLTELSSPALQTAIEGIAAERKLVGIAAKVVVGDAVVAQAETGYRTKEQTDPLLASDLFHVGSIGKSMSATAIATLVEDSVMRWDDTLGQRLPDVLMDAGWRDVTLHQLLTHTASIPRAPLAAMVKTVSEPAGLRDVRREIAAILLANPPETEPGTAFSYSNEGFMLASIMAEEATGDSWENIIQTRVAEPLGLSTLGFGAPTGNSGGDTPQSVPWGHRKLGALKIAMSPAGNPDNPPWMAAAGTMHMTLDDLLTYGRAHLNAGASETALLSPETYTRLHTPVLNDYAYGWVVQSRDFTDGKEGASEDPVIWHNGSNTMWYALLVLLPNQDTVFVIATNDGSVLNETQRAFDDLAAQIAKAIIADNTPGNTQ